MREYILNCGRIEYKCSDKEWRELEYLARWRADLAYIVERYGSDEPEAQVSRKSVEASFEQLDKMCVPFWLQNAALSFGEDWRNYKSSDFSEFLTKRGYGFRMRIA